MTIQRIAAFARDGVGGNPAGVVIGDTLPPEADMQRIAREVGYSETAFAAPQDDGFRTRYFAPEAEVPFCGHATIALGAALGAAHGAARYRLILNAAEIEVRAFEEAGEWGAELTSPPAAQGDVSDAVLAEALALFGLAPSDMSQDMRACRIHAGADHLALPLRRREDLASMRYDHDAGATFMRREGFVTVALFVTEGTGTVHIRNPFASGGVYEDPATGAAAAALTAWFRDGFGRTEPVTLYQGDDMGVPSRIEAQALPGKGAPVRVRGLTRHLPDPD